MLTAERLKSLKVESQGTAAEQETEFSYLPVPFKFTYLSIYLAQSSNIYYHYVQPLGEVSILNQNHLF